MSDTPTHSPVHIVAYGDDPFVSLSEQLLKQHQLDLPDLSNVTLLIAEPLAASRLRRILLDKAGQLGYKALLGPRISTLRDWVQQYNPADLHICDPHSQELILVEALNQHRELIRAANPWALADDLLNLFSELTLNKISLPDDLHTFTRQLAQAYGMSQGMNQSNISALSHEAALVHSLWHAWHTQLHANHLVDPHTAYQLALKNSLLDRGRDRDRDRDRYQDQTRDQNMGQNSNQVSTAQPGRLYLAGFHQLHKAETQWLRTLLQQEQACLFLHGQSDVAADQYHPDAVLNRLLAQLQLPVNTNSVSTNPYRQALDAVYSRQQQNLLQRSQQLREQYAESPLWQRLAVFMANGAEEEARAIDIQVRQWLLAGRRQIGIVTENRRVARRVRALLERADVHLHDAAGWALSTTSAAAALERWLECIEEDFSHLPLLDLLKSPFIFQYQDMPPAKEQVRQAAYRLEQDIIQHENIARDLSRYEHHIHERRKRLPDWFTDTDQLLLDLLQTMARAAVPLQNIQQGRHDAAAFLQALQTSMETLGMLRALETDAAGERLLQVIARLKQAAVKTPLQMNWSEFRTWLGRNLERFTFQPSSGSPTQFPVQLLGLAQSRLQRFDALIIASAERDHLPGKPGHSAFFNETVRRELGLRNHTEILAEGFHHFRRLLESASQILITARREQDGELISMSPWLENLQAFHSLAYGEALSAPYLQELVHRNEAQVIRSDDMTLPDRQQQPRPRVTAQQLPQSYSPSSYQKLLNCPYQFYAAKCLQLSPPEEISLALSKNEYGQRVHLCLEAFHHDVAELAGPFQGLLEENRHEEAIALLEQISAQVFARDLADNFEHRGWFKQWQQIIPYYIDWQITRAREWKVAELEQKRRLQFKPGLMINGRLDRIDRKPDSLSVIDYKTGKIATAEDVINGENIQLPFYALLQNLHTPDKRVQQVVYLQLDKAESVSKPHSLEGEQLEELSHAVAERLAVLTQQMQQGKPLPAWGDSRTCQYCEIKQLCRRQAWEQE